MITITQNDAEVWEVVDGKLELIGHKDLYVTEHPASKWVATKLKGLKKTILTPQMKNGLDVVETTHCEKMIPGYLGYLVKYCNDVRSGDRGCVSLLSCAVSGGHGISILPINFWECVTLFTARRCVLNQKVPFYMLHDSFQTPNVDSELWETYKINSLVHSLFETYSMQSSLRAVEFQSEKYDVCNQFFWMSRKEIEECANNVGFSELFNDARLDTKESYVYPLLQNNENLFPESQELLVFVSELMKKSIKQRKQMHEEYPEYHLNAWDAGFYQMKQVWKEYFPEELQQIRSIFQRLNNKMIPLTYEVGFLVDTFKPIEK